MTPSTCTPTRPTSTTSLAPMTWTATSLPASTCRPSKSTSSPSQSKEGAGPRAGAEGSSGRGSAPRGGPSAAPGTGRRVHGWLGPCSEDFFKLVRGLTITKGLRGANATFDFYTAPWAKDSSQEVRKKTVVDLETDILFLMSTKIALAQHRANAK